MKQLRTIVLAVLLLAVCLTVLPGQPAAVAETNVSALFINVGKADAILLFLDDQRFLVDTGLKKSYDALEQALQLYQVDRLDGVILTHTDKDHVGGLKKLLKSDIRVDALYAGALYSDPSLEEHPVYEAAQKNGITIQWLKAGDTIPAGDCSFQVLGPLSLDSQFENNNSLVMNLQTPEGNILLTGDMELKEEAELLEHGLIPQATVLKVAHHGEDDATSVRFVLAVKPQWAIISTSTADEPDTPDDKILSRLWTLQAGTAVTQDAEIGILVTLKDGTASVSRIDLP